MFTRTRSQFTDADRDFIATTLGLSEEERSGFIGPASDAEVITPYLRDERLLHRSMTRPPVFLDISPHLFFYIFTYGALDRRSIAGDDVADYIAGVCVEFRSAAALWHLAGSGEGTFLCVTDLLNLMQDLDHAQRHLLRKHIGDMTLFLTGFFPEYFRFRTGRRGAPPIGFYEEIARAQYGTAASDPRAEDEQMADVLNHLAENFPEVRTALNEGVSELRLAGSTGRGGGAS